MLVIASPEVVNLMPPAVAKGIEVILWLSEPRTSTVLSGYLAMTITSLPTTPPLAHLFTKESTKE